MNIMVNISDVLRHTSDHGTNTFVAWSNYTQYIFSFCPRCDEKITNIVPATLFYFCPGRAIFVRAFNGFPINVPLTLLKTIMSTSHFISSRKVAFKKNSAHSRVLAQHELCNG